MDNEAFRQPEPWYYLHNFHRVLDWVSERYADVLSGQERSFIDRFRTLPQPSQGLLVRLVMRKGEWFRADKLSYSEIGDIDTAAAPLLELGWLNESAPVPAADFARLLTRVELSQVLKQQSALAGLIRKSDLVHWLLTENSEPRSWRAWWPDAPCVLYQITVMPLCDRFRLMFFGNLRQEWSTFVLAELGTFQFEPVPMADDARPFDSALDVTLYEQLHQCRKALESGVEPEAVLDTVPAAPDDNLWLQRRRERLLYQLAYAIERQGNLTRALSVYTAIQHPGARVRRLRILEKQAPTEALVVLEQAKADPESEAELQQLHRIEPRLRRKLDVPVLRSVPGRSAPEQTRILPDDGRGVEQQAADALATDEAPVLYMENTLFNGLLGLLCWDAVFAPLPGAFFHPYQSGPADLNRPEFHQARKDLLDAALAELDSGTYKDTVRCVHREKFGRMNPFVHWGMLSAERLELALQCLPPVHLRLIFERILFDIPANRSGLPDLIQFYPDQPSYELIEVKGPGDRLQDNQKRWLAFCMEHGLPVSVLYVTRPDNAGQESL